MCGKLLKLLNASRKKIDASGTFFSIFIFFVEEGVYKKCSLSPKLDKKNKAKVSIQLEAGTHITIVTLEPSKQDPV